MMTDPIADMLTRIRNAGMARHAQTSCPSSKQKLAIASVLQRAGFLDSVRVEEKEGHASLVLGIRYDDAGRPLIDGIQRVSKPGRRVYSRASELLGPSAGQGIYVLSTDRGVVSDREARERNAGGEVLCKIS